MSALYHTRGICLHYVRFRETSLVVRMYTEAFGLQGYIVNGVRSARAHPRMAYYQPLSLLDLTVYHRPHADLNRISQVSLHDPSLLPEPGIIKTTLRIFLAEVLMRVLQEQEPNPDMFAFIFDSLRAFEAGPGTEGSGIENFHLQFLLRLASYLGYGLEHADQLIDQVYQLGGGQGPLALSDDRDDPAGATPSARPIISAGGHAARQEDAEAIEALLGAPYLSPLPLPGRLRQHLLDLIVAYYRGHIEGMPPVRSLEVLRQVLRP